MTQFVLAGYYYNDNRFITTWTLTSIPAYLTELVVTSSWLFIQRTRVVSLFLHNKENEVTDYRSGQFVCITFNWALLYSKQKN